MRAQIGKPAVAAPPQPRAVRAVGVVAILLAALLAIAPQLIQGISCGHDFDFHLVSWFDALNAWRHGIMYPHWAASANYGAGEPRFVFYSPLTWMLGAALAAVLPWTWVPVVVTYLLLAGTGLATRALARQALDEASAALAGCVAIFSGYALFTAYERSAFAELAGGVWIPLVLLFALSDRGDEAVPAAPVSVVRRALDGSAVPLALAIAGSWLANPTVGVMACYTLAAVALVRALVARSWAPVLRGAVGGALGMGLIGIYLLPAAWEQRWVDIHQVTEDPGQTLENNWLFAVHADPALALHDQVLRTASILAVLMIAVALIGLLVSWLRGRLPGQRQWWIPLALIAPAVLCLQFAFSRPLWNLLPELRFLQFPWRWLLVLEAPMAIFLVAAVGCTRLWRRVAVVEFFAAVFLVIAVFTSHAFFQVCEDEDAVPGMLTAYGAGQGFIGTNEYEPIGADNALVATGLPLACLVSDPDVPLGAAVPDPDSNPAWTPKQESCDATFAAAGNHPNPEHLRIAVDLPHSGFLILRLRSYPAWRVRVNGQLVTALPPRADGLLAVPVAQGPVVLTVDWTATIDVLVARWLSVLSVFLLTCLYLLERRGRTAAFNAAQLR